MARTVILLALAYALSPLDLVPDFIPVLGVIDDLILLPAVIWLAVKLIPAQVWERARERAETEPLRLKDSWSAVLVVFCVWNGCLLLLVYLLTVRYGNRFWKGHVWLGMLIAALIASFGEAAWYFGVTLRVGQSAIDAEAPLLQRAEETQGSHVTAQNTSSLP